MIIKNCEAAGTFRDCFMPVIETLSGILEIRDDALKRYGGDPVVEHTNKGGATNTVKNPALVAILDCNTQALAYWRDLGLTPAGLKRLNENAMKEPENKETFASVLEKLGA